MKEGRKPEYPEKTPDDELQKMLHTKARKFNPQPRLEPALWYWWQAGKEWYPLHHAAPLLIIIGGWLLNVSAIRVYLRDGSAQP